MPSVEQFAQANPDVIVAGIGAQDSLTQAQDFVSSTEADAFLMTWDAVAASWSHYGVVSQPFTIVLDNNGNELARLSGTFDPQAVSAALP